MRALIGQSNDSPFPVPSSPNSRDFRTKDLGMGFFSDSVSHKLWKIREDDVFILERYRKKKWHVIVLLFYSADRATSKKSSSSAVSSRICAKAQTLVLSGTATIGHVPGRKGRSDFLQSLILKISNEFLHESRDGISFLVPSSPNSRDFKTKDLGIGFFCNSPTLLL